MKLLTRRQIEVINDISNICNSILLGFWRLKNHSFLILETVLNNLPRIVIVSGTFVPFLRSTISIRRFFCIIFAKITFIDLLLVSKVYLILVSDVFCC